MLLSGRKALITGAAGRIGEAIARRFAEEGCSVIMADLREEEVNEAAERLKRQGFKAEAAVFDVSDEEAVKRAFAGIDRLDILVNNAGVTRGGSVQDLSLQEWNGILNVNLTSMFLCSKYALPLLKQSRAPAIVNMASINAIRMNPGLPAYAAAKSGVIALTQQLAIEGAAFRIRANCISPGRTMTVEEQRRGAAQPGFAAEIDCYPLGRMGYPEDVANAALFLASDMAAFVNGINLVVDGGLSLQAVTGLVRPELRKRWKQGVYRFDPEG